MSTHVVTPPRDVPFTAVSDAPNPRRTWRTIQLACIWSGVPMLLMLMIGLVASGFIPPIHPSKSAAEVANIYRTNTDQIRLWLAFSFLSITLLFPFGMAIAAQTRRLEGRGPVLTYIQIAGLGSGSMIFVLPWIFWFVAAFRPERPASQILLVNDLGWITFVTAFVAFFSWLAAIGVAILSDHREEPIFPRWLGYWNLFVAVSFIPDICVPFFKHGAFSWTGIFPFYFPFTTYLIWIILMMVYTSRAIKTDPEFDVRARHTGSADML
jgi:hypothetical protein